MNDEMMYEIYHILNIMGALFIFVQSPAIFSLSFQAG